MAAQKSPLLGYNHNLKYKGRVYHVQTEDSGLDNPHTFTHLFHSGSILRTSKQEYRDLLGDPEWESKLRERMQVQHKEMIRELVKGLCDDRILAFFGTLEAEVEEEVPMATLQPPPRRERTTKGEAVAPAPPVQQVQQAVHGLLVNLVLRHGGGRQAVDPAVAVQPVDVDGDRGDGHGFRVHVWPSTAETRRN